MSDLDTLIADMLERHNRLFDESWGAGYDSDSVRDGDALAFKLAASALTDLRAERDAALAVIEKVRADVDYNGHAFGCQSEDDRWEPRKPCDCYVAILATAPTKALADREAHIWDEGFDAGYDSVLVEKSLLPAAPDLRVNPYLLTAQKGEVQ